MPRPQTFGRRETKSALTPFPTPGRPIEPLSPKAEAFRADLKASGFDNRSSFGAWRRSRRGEAILTGAVAIGCVSPGLLGFLLQAPVGVSIGLEIAGLTANAWVRRRRRQRLKAIVAWQDPAGD